MAPTSISRSGRVPRHWIVAALAFAALLRTGEAQAQGTQVKPYVMLLFDTSGSMVWPVCYSSAILGFSVYSAINGDNSSECPGNQMTCSPNCGTYWFTGCGCNTLGCDNGVADDSRLYKVKKGAYSVVNAFGEVTFGLSRFRNLPATFTCAASTYGRVGGWQGDDCSSSMGTGGNQADILVEFSDTNQTQVLNWMNNCDDYPTVGACGGTLPPTSGCSLCADCGGGCDLEIRGVSATPIAGALYDLRVNYFNSKVLPADSKKACRPYKVILITDGEQTTACPGNPATEAKNLYQNSARSIPVHVLGFGSSSLKANLDAIAVAGGTKASVVVDNEISLALAMASIISESVLAESCNGKDDDCDDECDEDFPEVAVSGSGCKTPRTATSCTAGLGICQKTGAYVCKSDGSGSQCNAVAGSPNPLGEICDNGLDDDCDGLVDEGCTPSCVPTAEICDGKDNDCDKQIDEGYVSVACGSTVGECKAGTTACQNGKVVCLGSTGPTTELCDGKDNNCDTVVDLLSQSCYPASTGCSLTTGLCLGTCSIGAELCTLGKWGSCLGYQGPITEVCNGLDDDCDGLVDDGVGNTCMDYKTCTTFVTCQPCAPTPVELCDLADNDCNKAVDDNTAGEGVPCGSAVGECTAGKMSCQNGKMVCQGASSGTSEVCDNKDNDCNAKIDDNVPGDGAACGTDLGECKKGVQKCIGGKFICQGGVGPQSEVCDGKDNDCDGVNDNNATCPGQSKCIEGVCVSQCLSGEFPCPGGYICQSGYCVPSACAKVTCQPTERCQIQNGKGVCVPRCQGVSCQSYEKCDPLTGQCKDDSCKTKGCPKGQRCDGVTCVPDPCPPGTCAADQMCSEGKCYGVCLGVKCPPGQSCVKGTCRPQNPCETHICDVGYACEVKNGQAACVPDPCGQVSCTSGQVCYQGKCVKDPCQLSTCPTGFACKLTVDNEPTCEPTGTPLASTRAMVAAGGAGGCAVSVSDEPDLPLWPSVLGLLLLLGRRGRPRVERGRVAPGLGRLVGLGALVAVSLLGCQADPYTLTINPEAGFGDGGSDMDGAAGEVGPADLRRDGDGCVKDPKGEICDKLDNDCNGTVDDVDSTKLLSDAKNCGKCGNECSIPNAFPKCEQGKCLLGSCAPGFMDINKDATDGCEYMCVQSNGGVEACDGLDNDCDKQIDEDFNLSTNVSNCGSCGIACSFKNAAASCQSSQCVMGACTSGFADLDKQSVTGCEYQCPVWPALTTDLCDGKDDDCDGKADEDFVSASCGNTQGVCKAGSTQCIGGKEVCQGYTLGTVEICDTLDNDCDGKADEDFDKQNDPRYCGGCTACSLANAFANCKAGVCGVAACKTGYFDLDLKPANGCEYACTVSGAEICDGEDNDCDGLIDTADSGLLTPSGSYCATSGVCAGTTVSCKGSQGWVCGYPSTAELLACSKDADCGGQVTCTGGFCPGILATQETQCDGLDNDCDGQTDELFSDKNKTCLESGKQGVCQGTGTWLCNTQKNGLTCTITKPGASAKNELCNGLDDDCDGKIDEETDDGGYLGVVDSMVHIKRSYQGKNYDFYIYMYEASRPDATATSGGASTVRACSNAGVLPWANLTYAQADAACKAAGKRLCSPTEWTMACGGSSLTNYPYGSTYSTTSCNGKDYSSSSDKVLATGQPSTCKSSDGVYDMSGNLKEWTDDPAQGSTDPEMVRGGGYDTIAGGLRCDFTFVVMPKTYYYANLGFRCCSDTAP